MRGFIIIASLILMQLWPAPASLAAGACDYYRYFGQQTALSDANVSNACSATNPLYYGWAGINGRIVTPSAVPSMPNYFDHVNGNLGITFGPNSPADIQIGWFTQILGNSTGGCAYPNCASSYGAFSMYLEYTLPNGAYSISNLGGISPRTAIIYRVQRASSGAFNVFDFYSNLVGTVSGLPSTGAASAQGEAYRAPGTSSFPKLPTATFGTSDQTTNQAMRLLGANGYEPWDTMLLAAHTLTFYDSGNTVMARLNDHWYFLGYSL